MDTRNLRFMDLRQRFNLTQTELGKSVGLSQSMIAHIESGTKEPKGIYKLRLAHRFGVSVEWLFYEEVYKEFYMSVKGGQSNAANNERLSTFA